MGNNDIRIDWHRVERGRALAFACRVDRQLHEASQTAPRPETVLAARLRRRLRDAVTSNSATQQLFAVVAAVHEQLAFLPAVDLPVGLRGFLREVLGSRWDSEVVVAAVSAPQWPRHEQDRRAAHRPAVFDDLQQPVTVIPRAEMYNPLMWPLVGLQVAAYAGWEDAERRVRQRIGSGLTFALAEAFVMTDGEKARRLWERGLDALAAETETAGQTARAGVRTLARSLADGILISAHRRGKAEAKSGQHRGVYADLAAAYDEPASPADILHAGWTHWYEHGLTQLLKLEKALTQGETTDADPVIDSRVAGVAIGKVPADAWTEMCHFVNGIDDLLCRSLDVAAIHRFYATGGAGR